MNKQFWLLFFVFGLAVVCAEEMTFYYVTNKDLQKAFKDISEESGTRFPCSPTTRLLKNEKSLICQNPYKYDVVWYLSYDGSVRIEDTNECPLFDSEGKKVASIASVKNKMLKGEGIEYQINMDRHFSNKEGKFIAVNSHLIGRHFAVKDSSHSISEMGKVYNRRNLVHVRRTASPYERFLQFDGTFMGLYDSDMVESRGGFHLIVERGNDAKKEIVLLDVVGSGNKKERSVSLDGRYLYSLAYYSPEKKVGVFHKNTWKAEFLIPRRYTLFVNFLTGEVIEKKGREMALVSEDPFLEHIPHRSVTVDL